MKRLLVAIITFILAAGCFAGCGGGGDEGERSPVIDGAILDGYTPSGTLTVWSFTTELGQIADKFKERYPDVTIKFQAFDYNTLQTKLEPLLGKSSANAPDIIGLSSSWAPNYFKTNWLADVSFLEPELDAMESPQGIIDFGKDQYGKLKGVSYQCSMGGVYYRKDYARKYLGTDDPAAIQEYFKDMETRKETARNISEASNGKCFMYPTIDAVVGSYMSSRDSGWIDENGKLYVDSNFESFVSDVKYFRQNNYEAKLEKGSAPYIASYTDGAKNNSNEVMEVFAYGSSTFFPEFELKPVFVGNNAKYANGYYGVITGSNPTCSGGTWNVMNATAKNQQLAASFMKFIASDEQFYEEWAKESYDLVASKKIVRKLANDPALINPMLGANINSLYLEHMDSTILDKVSAYDAECSTYLYAALNKCIDENLTPAQTKAYFIETVCSNIRAIKRP